MCFRHRIAGVGFTFVGGGSYGREAFHNGTAKEFAEGIERGAAARGQKIRKLSTRAELV